MNTHNLSVSQQTTWNVVKTTWENVNYGPALFIYFGQTWSRIIRFKLCNVIKLLNKMVLIKVAGMQYHSSGPRIVASWKFQTFYQQHIGKIGSLDFLVFLSVAGVIGLICGSAVACGIIRLLCKDQDSREGASDRVEPGEHFYMDYNTGTMKVRSPTIM